jgi:hypothetical protein
MIVLPGITDHVGRRRCSGDVVCIDTTRSNKCRKLATVYGNSIEEVRRDKWAVVRRLEIEYRTLWCEEGSLMTDTMRAALRVLRAFGKRDFALLASKSTVRAMIKRGIIDGAFDILAKYGRVDPLHDSRAQKRYRTLTK